METKDLIRSINNFEANIVFDKNRSNREFANGQSPFFFTPVEKGERKRYEKSENKNEFTSTTAAIHIMDSSVEELEELFKLDDSGIYEYLLGDCLEVMQDKAKGQLIFTSHNLCPLEILENDSLLYTTVNPENCYIKSSYIKNTQNTRLSYLRTIKLGGQKEKLYNETNIYEMKLAMRRAGRIRAND